MLLKVVNIILAIAIVEGRSSIFLRENGDPTADVPLPSFEDVECPEAPQDASDADLCINVHITPEISELMVLTKTTDTIYEGYLGAKENHVFVVMIDEPEDNSRLINFHHNLVGHCTEFDVDRQANTVQCVRGGFATTNDAVGFEFQSRYLSERTFGPIIPLGKYFPNGIDIKVLFTFDNAFYKFFNGEKGQKGKEYMNQVIALVRNAYKDNSLTNRIKTGVNIIGEAKRYDGTFTAASFPEEDDQFETALMSNLANAEGAKYDLYTFISYPGASGVAVGQSLCEKSPRKRVSRIYGYGATECGAYDPPTKIDCTKLTNRIALTAQTIAHELGHSMGMEHDFDQTEKEVTGKYVYRKYEKETKDCRGLMDYIDDGVGWSACSAHDFSRYLTDGGTKKPCLLKDSNKPTTKAAPTPAAPTPAPPTTAAPTTAAPTTKPACIGDVSTWTAGWGKCATYKTGQYNGEFGCASDCVNGQCANQVCAECGACTAIAAGK